MDITLEFSLPWCISSLVVIVALSITTVTLNIITTIVFIKNRELRKRSKYLLISLAVVNMLVGGFNGPNANERSRRSNLKGKELCWNI